MDTEDLLSHSRLGGKNITLCVTGGIASYKAVELLRTFQKAGAKVRVVMTRMATRFVGEETFSSLTGQKVLVDFEGMEHINVSHSSDLIVVAPATANTIGKFANGICDTMTGAILLSANCPIVFVPSMNWSMLKNPITSENIEKIKKIGHTVVQPDEGELACGERGEGRFPSPEKILFHCELAISSKRLRGKKVVVTAGPTREHIDDVRFISNPSSGFMGFVLAWEVALEGAETYLVTGGHTFGAEKLFRTKKVTSADEMLDEVMKLAPMDVFIGSAAVSDFKPALKTIGKIKKEGLKDLEIRLIRTPDITENVRGHTKILVGFALETDETERRAIEKMMAKRMDMIVGNSPDSFSRSESEFIIAHPESGEVKVERIGRVHKRRLAQIVIEKIIRITGVEKIL